MLEEEVDGEEEELEFDGTGTFQPFSDNETTTLFQDLERELEKMVQKYHVPPTDLENLFQVVQNLFEMMDTSRETYESLVEQKAELEELWKNEKDKSRVAQRRKLELECRMEEEKLRLESEKGILQKDKVSLETKLKQAIEHKSHIEQELVRLKDKTSKDDQTRNDLLNTYKKQYDKARQSSLRRVASGRSTHRRLPLVPHSWETGTLGIRTSERVQTTPDSVHSSEDSLPHSVTSGSGVSVSVSQSAMPLSPSLDVELDEREGERAELSEQESSRAFGESYEEMPLGMQPPPPPPMPVVMSSPEEDTGSEDEAAVIAPENREGLSLEEELMGAVSPELLAPTRTELEMLQKEKESWKAEKERLEKQREDARSEREALESQYAQVQVELQHLQEKHKEMQGELVDVRKERDEVLDMYLDQPFDDYCITRKELLDLLRRHHNTTIELEKEKEEKQRLQSLLDAKKSFFERFKQSMRKMFSRYPRQSTSSGSSDRGRSFTPSDDHPHDTSHSEISPPPRPPSPLTRVIAHSMELMTNKGWMSSQDSSVSLNILPNWIGQIALSGIETERVDCATVGRVFSSEEMSPTPPRSRFNRRLSPAHHPGGVQQLHAEVWVATTENSISFVEIVDILSRTSKVRQRFVVKPRTAHIVCMKAIPGSVEESVEFTDSALIGEDTSWVEEAFSPFGIHRSYSDTIPVNKTAAWHGGSSTDLLNPPLTLDSDRMQFTQSLTSIQRNGHGGQKARSASVIEGGGSQGVVRRLDFSLNDKLVADKSSVASVVERDAASSPDHQPLSQSLGVWNQDTILEDREGTDSPDSGPFPDGEAVGDSKNGGCGGGGRRMRRRRTSSVKLVMWVVTEDNRLVFYPTTDPSHIPLNSVTLPSRSLCLEYIKGKVYIGHTKSKISIFHPDEFLNDTWDIQNPTNLALPSCDANICYDVKCIASVGSELWIGAGPSVFFLDEESLERRGSKFINNWHHRPEKILPVGNLVLVATRASALYVFDRQQHEVLRKFDITPIISLLDSPKRKRKPSHATPTSIKCLEMDDTSVFIGTSSGHIVTIPKEKLSQKQAPPSPPKTPSPPQQLIPTVQRDRDVKIASLSGPVVVPPRKPPRKGRRSKGTQTTNGSKKSSPLVHACSSDSQHFGGSEEYDSSEHDEVNGVFLDQSGVSLHCHKDRVRALLYISLPRSRRDLSSQSPNHPQGHFNSMPNLSSSSYRLPLGQPLFKSLLLSVGKGHLEYSTLLPDPEQNLEDASARRERNKAFQLMLWGHRNSIP